MTRDILDIARELREHPDCKMLALITASDIKTAFEGMDTTFELAMPDDLWLGKTEQYMLEEGFDALYAFGHEQIKEQ